MFIYVLFTEIRDGQGQNVNGISLEIEGRVDWPVAPLPHKCAFLTACDNILTSDYPGHIVGVDRGESAL
jgi:hypothetical protein